MPSDRFSKKVIWWVPTITAVLAFLWELETQIEFSHTGWAMLAINTILALVIVGIIYVFLNRFTWAFDKFLKIGDEEKITIVIASYQNIHRWDATSPKDARERYFKVLNGREVLLEGAHGYLAGMETTRMTTRFAYRLRDLTDHDLVVIADEQPPTGDGPLICFGSPRSNFRSSLFLPTFVEFPNANTLSVTIDGTAMPYSSDDHTDYGIVSRNQMGNRWGFVCAGIDEEGTIAAGFYLLNEWKELNQYQGEFVHIIKCTKKDPEAPSRFLGFSPVGGVWKSDGAASR